LYQDLCKHSKGIVPTLKSYSINPRPEVLEQFDMRKQKVEEKISETIAAVGSEAH